MVIRLKNIEECRFALSPPKPPESMSTLCQRPPLRSCVGHRTHGSLLPGYAGVGLRMAQESCFRCWDLRLNAETCSALMQLGTGRQASPVAEHERWWTAVSVCLCLSRLLESGMKQTLTPLSGGWKAGVQAELVSGDAHFMVHRHCVLTVSPPWWKGPGSSLGSPS